MSRLLTIVSSLLLVAAVGVGVAVASDSGYGSSQHDQGSSGAKPGKGKKWRQFKDLEETQIALTAYLTGKPEINEEGQDGAGDPVGRGTATFFVGASKTLCYSFLVRGLDEAPDKVHIHRAKAGQNGDVVIDFSAKGLPKNGTGQPAGNPGWSSGCKLLEGTELQALNRLLSNPKGYYVNIHTPSFPGGAIRGQLSRMLFDND